MNAFDVYCRKGIDALFPDEKKALTVSNDSTGGYLAPPEYVRELLKEVTEISLSDQLQEMQQLRVKDPFEFLKEQLLFSAQWVSESGTRSETEGYNVGLEELPST